MAFDLSADTRVLLGLEAEVGLWNDRALYASFGQECQIFKFSKLILPIRIHHKPSDWGSQLSGVIELAPLYDSIRAQKPAAEKIYGQDSNGQNIDGAWVYRDWYKNLGSRVYDVGGVPLVQAYVRYGSPWGALKLGRQKNFIGFKDKDVPWGDDGKMAPYSHWLSRDLLTGCAGGLKLAELRLIAGIFSGGNALKAGGTYLDSAQGPNRKANNTPTVAIKLQAKGQVGPALKGNIWMGYQRARLGSTWSDALQDGKHICNVGAVGGMVDFEKLSSSWSLTSLKLFGQYTFFSLGLDPKSSQNDGHPRFKSLMQHGFFLGGQLGLQGGLSFWVVHEQFRRMDFGVYKSYDFNVPGCFQKANQSSWIVGAGYQIYDGLSLSAAWHRLKNPLAWVSGVLDTRGSNRWSVTLSARY